MVGPIRSEVEARFAGLRKKLDDGGYLESFGVDSLRLVEHLYKDLKETTESLQETLLKYVQYKKIAEELENGVEPFKEENIRLYKENSQLRMNAARVLEDAEDKARDPLLRVRDLEAENNDLKLLVSQFAERLKKAEIDALEKTNRLAKLQEKNLGLGIVVGEKGKSATSQCKPTMEIDFFLPNACPQCIRLRNYVEYGKNSDRNPSTVDYVKMADSRIEALQLQLRSFKNLEKEHMALIASLKSRINTRDAEIEKLRDLIQIRPGRDNKVNGFSLLESDNMEKNLAAELKTAEMQLKLMQQRNIELEEKLKKSILQEHEDYMLGKLSTHFGNRNLAKICLEKELDKYPSHDKMNLLEKLYHLERQLSHCCKEKAKLQQQIAECHKNHVRLSSQEVSRQESLSRTAMKGKEKSVTRSRSPPRAFAKKSEPSIRFKVGQSQNTTLFKRAATSGGTKSFSATAPVRKIVGKGVPVPSTGLKKGLTRGKIGGVPSTQQRKEDQTSSSDSRFGNVENFELQRPEQGYTDMGDVLEVTERRQKARFEEEENQEYSDDVEFDEDEYLEESEEMQMTQNKSSADQRRAEGQPSKTSVTSSNISRRGITHVEEPSLLSVSEFEYSSEFDRTDTQAQRRSQDKQQRYGEQVDPAASSSDLGHHIPFDRGDGNIGDRQNKKTDALATRVPSQAPSSSGQAQKMTRRMETIGEKGPKRGAIVRDGDGTVSNREMEREASNTRRGEREINSHSKQRLPFDGTSTIHSGHQTPFDRRDGKTGDRQNHKIKQMTMAKNMPLQTSSGSRQAQKMTKGLETIGEKEVKRGTVVEDDDGTASYEEMSETEAYSRQGESEIITLSRQGLPFDGTSTTNSGHHVPLAQENANIGDRQSSKTNPTTKKMPSQQSSGSTQALMMARGMENKGEKEVKRGTIVEDDDGTVSYGEMSASEAYIRREEREINPPARQGLPFDGTSAGDLGHPVPIERGDGNIGDRQNPKTNPVAKKMPLQQSSGSGSTQAQKSTRGLETIGEKEVNRGTIVGDDDGTASYGEMSVIEASYTRRGEREHNPLSRQRLPFDGTSTTDVGHHVPFDQGDGNIGDRQNPMGRMRPSQTSSGSRQAPQMTRGLETIGGNEVKRGTVVEDDDGTASYGEMSVSEASYTRRGEREINPLSRQGRSFDGTSANERGLANRNQQAPPPQDPYSRARTGGQTFRTVGVNTDEQMGLSRAERWDDMQEKSALNEKIAMLQRKLDDVHQESSRHQLKSFELQGELERTKHMLQIERQERELANTELKRLRDLNSESTARLLMNSAMGSDGSFRRGATPMEMEREIMNLRGALSSLDRDKDEMRVELDRKDERLARLMSEGQRYLDEISDLKLRLKNAELQISHTGESAKEQSREADFLKKQLESNRRDLDRTIRERDDALRELHKITSAHSKGQLERRSVETELELKNKEADDLRKQVQRYIDEVRRIEELLLDKEEELETILQHYKALTAENNNLEAQRTSLEREAFSIRESVKDAVDQNITFKNQLASQNALVQSLEEEIQRFTQQIAHLENQLESKTEKEKMLEADVKASKDLIYRLEVQMDKLKLDLADSDSKRKQLEAENSELNSHIAALEARLQEETDRQRQLENLVASSREKDFKLEKTTHDISRERDELAEKLTSLQQRSESLSTEVSRYRLKSIELQSELDRTRRQLDSEKRERDTTVSELRKLREQLHSSSANKLLTAALGTTGSSSSSRVGGMDSSPLQGSSAASTFRQNLMTEIPELRASREPSPFASGLGAAVEITDRNIPLATSTSRLHTTDDPITTTGMGDASASQSQAKPNLTGDDDEFEAWDSPNK